MHLETERTGRPRRTIIILMALAALLTACTPTSGSPHAEDVAPSIDSAARTGTEDTSDRSSETTGPSDVAAMPEVLVSASNKAIGSGELVTIVVEIRGSADSVLKNAAEPNYLTLSLPQTGKLTAELVEDAAIVEVFRPDLLTADPWVPLGDVYGAALLAESLSVFSLVSEWIVHHSLITFLPSAVEKVLPRIASLAFGDDLGGPPEGPLFDPHNTERRLELVAFGRTDDFGELRMRVAVPIRLHGSGEAELGVHLAYEFTSALQFVTNTAGVQTDPISVKVNPPPTPEQAAEPLTWSSEALQIDTVPIGGSVAVQHYENALWVANGGSNGAVYKLHPDTLETLNTIPVEFPMSIAVGEGSIWVASSPHEDTLLLRIDPSSGQITGSKRLDAFDPSLAVGANSVWVSSCCSPPTVTRVDPTTLEPIAEIEVGRPSALTYGGGALWVANGQAMTVSQINPPTNTITTTVDLEIDSDGCCTSAASLVHESQALWVAVSDEPHDGSLVKIDLIDMHQDAVEIGHLEGTGAFHDIIHATPSSIVLAAGPDKELILYNIATEQSTLLPLEYEPLSIHFNHDVVWVGTQAVTLRLAPVEPQ